MPTKVIGAIIVLTVFFLLSLGPWFIMSRDSETVTETVTLSGINLLFGAVIKGERWPPDGRVGFAFVAVLLLSGLAMSKSKVAAGATIFVAALGGLMMFSLRIAVDQWATQHSVTVDWQLAYYCTSFYFLLCALVGLATIIRSSKSSAP